MQLLKNLCNYVKKCVILSGITKPKNIITTLQLIIIHIGAQCFNQLSSINCIYRRNPQVKKWIGQNSQILIVWKCSARRKEKNNSHDSRFSFLFGCSFVSLLLRVPPTPCINPSTIDKAKGVKGKVVCLDYQSTSSIIIQSQVPSPRRKQVLLILWDLTNSFRYSELFFSYWSYWLTWVKLVCFI